MKTTILDGYSINPGDLSWDCLKEFGSLEVHSKCEEDDIIQTIGDSDYIFESKIKMTRYVMENCPNLKFIGETATGYDNVDVAAARELGIAVTNVPAYSSDAVAQHAIALILELSNMIMIHDISVHNGEWVSNENFCYWKKPLVLLKGRSLGIIGYGSIGQRVAHIAEALGMSINVWSKDPESTIQSDFISLHCPATPDNIGFINKSFVNKMKHGAAIINTARGTLINEQDIADALSNGRLSGFAADVLSQEPPAADNPLLTAPNCILTPHIAWSPSEMRQIVIDTCYNNLRSFLDGGDLNRIV